VQLIDAHSIPLPDGGEAGGGVHRATDGAGFTRNSLSDGKFHVLPNSGDLHVHRVDFSDALMPFSCKVRDKLTGREEDSAAYNLVINGEDEGQAKLFSLPLFHFFLLLCQPRLFTPNFCAGFGKRRHPN